MNINAISSYHKIKSDIQGNFRTHQAMSAFYRTGAHTTAASQLEIAKPSLVKKGEGDQGLVGARVWGNRLLREARPSPVPAPQASYGSLGETGVKRAVSATRAMAQSHFSRTKSAIN